MSGTKKFSILPKKKRGKKRSTKFQLVAFKPSFTLFRENGFFSKLFVDKRAKTRKQLLMSGRNFSVGVL